MRLSLIGISISYIYAIYWSLYEGDLISKALVGLAFPLSMIFAISMHSLPRTFRSKPHPIALLSVPLLALGLFDYRFYLMSLIPYLIGSKYFELPRYCKLSKEIGGIAGKGLFYYCCGHAFSVIALIFPLIFYSTPLTFLHTMLLGFVSIHVFIHLPTMIPPILGIKNARRYNYFPYVLTILASALWPFFKDLSWLLYFSALIAVALVFLPLNLPKRGTKSARRAGAGILA
ncbi:hypothetical protein IPA_02265 [Ignicoccus pacificus DSM 13166]|uniref:Uncharacterized protein n=1 Tax=Ignicoccus pacificus DSM 13166 TaxID=940294 RepID=A0A977KAN7_9CREN|nr:hypothetical protein IPA_02265 [Ignicoccus pacificus DSM 13166]